MAKRKAFLYAVALWLGLLLYLDTKDSALSRISFAVPRRALEDNQGGERQEDSEELRFQAAGRLLDLAMEHVEKAEYQRAVDLLREAFELHGPSNTSSLAAEILLAHSEILWDHMGYSPEALPLAEEALRLRREALGQDGWELLETLSWLGDLYRMRGDSLASLELRNESLTIERAALGTEDEDLVEHEISVRQVAECLTDIGNLAEAIPLRKESMRLARINWGALSLEYTESMDDMVDVYLEMCSFSQAEPLLIHSLAIMRKAHGPQSAEYAASLAKLAGVWHKMGKSQLAVPHYEHVLELWKQVLGSNHSDYLETLETLAEVHKGLGDLVKATSLYEEASSIRKELYGPVGALSLQGLADAYSEMGALEKLLQLTQERRTLAETRSDILVDSLQEFTTTRVTLDSFATLIDREFNLLYLAPLTMYMMSLRCLEKELGVERSSCGSSLRELAGLFERLGKIDWALPLFEVSRRLQEQKLPDTGTLEMLRDTLQWLADRDRLADLPMMQDGASGFPEGLLKEHCRLAPIVACLHNVAAMYRARADYARARPYAERALCERIVMLHKHTRTETLRSQLSRVISD